MVDMTGIAEARRGLILRACCFCDADETFKNTNQHRYCLRCEVKRVTRELPPALCGHVQRGK
jgi:hypothetical protein